MVTVRTQSHCAVPGARSHGQQLSVIWARVLLVLFGTWVERKKEAAFGNEDWVSRSLFICTVMQKWTVSHVILFLHLPLQTLVCTSVELLNQLFLSYLHIQIWSQKMDLSDMAQPCSLSLRGLAWKSQSKSCCRGFPHSLCPGACRSPHLLESSPVFVGLGASAVAPGALGAHPSLCLFQSPLALLCTFPCPELEQGAKN